MPPESIEPNDERGFNLLDPEFVANPYPRLAEWRRKMPCVAFPDRQSAIIVRYDDVLRCLRDPVRFSSDHAKHLLGTGRYQLRDGFGSLVFDVAGELRKRWMLTTDSPAHERLRGALIHAFSPASMDALAPRIQAIVDGLFNDVIQRGGEYDAVAELALPLPVAVICEILGLGREDANLVGGWARQTALLLEEPGPRLVSRVEAIAREAVRFFGLIVDRGTAVHGGLLSSLMHPGSGLDPREAIAQVILLFVAGHETTVNLLGNGLWLLLTNPDAKEELRRDLALVPEAVEEMLRYESPVKAIARFTTREEIFGDVKLPVGTQIILSLASANRDEAIFDDADRFDIHRERSRHLAFGQGAHFCLGAQLARLEAKIFFTSLLSRPQRITLLEPNVVWSRSVTMRRLSRLPIRFDSAE
jgi:cytochrome P450